jgi:hypothetical protein
MNKDWEREQIDRLIQKQKNKISELTEDTLKNQK